MRRITSGEILHAHVLASAATVASNLVEWFRLHRRDLPWRRNSDDAYSVWISEVMLQQTQAATVVPYYLLWMERWPTVTSLAAAPLDEVLAAWSGLGYYARARNIHRAAGMIVERFGGRIPSDAALLGSLPGVGLYTVGAILSIAFNRPVPAMDVNAIRVLSRLMAADGTAAGARGAMEALVTAMMSTEAARDVTQALMELGALVCLPTNPRCQECPILHLCRAAAAGRPDQWPAPRPKPKPVSVEHAAIIIHRMGTYLVARRHEMGRWGGLWEFPHRECLPNEPPEECATRAAREVVGIYASAGPCIARVRHRFTHYAVTLTAYQAGEWKGAPTAIGCADVRWAHPRELTTLALSSPQKAIVKWLLDRECAPRAGDYAEPVE